jgi:hypothetical protein
MSTGSDNNTDNNASLHTPHHHHGQAVTNAIAAALQDSANDKNEPYHPNPRTTVSDLDKLLISNPKCSIPFQFVDPTFFNNFSSHNSGVLQ